MSRPEEYIGIPQRDRHDHGAFQLRQDLERPILERCAGMRCAASQEANTLLKESLSFLRYSVGKSIGASSQRATKAYQSIPFHRLEKCLSQYEVWFLRTWRQSLVESFRVPLSYRNTQRFLRGEVVMNTRTLDPHFSSDFAKTETVIPGQSNVLLSGVHYFYLHSFHDIRIHTLSIER